MTKQLIVKDYIQEYGIDSGWCPLARLVAKVSEKMANTCIAKALTPQ